MKQTSFYEVWNVVNYQNVRCDSVIYGSEILFSQDQKVVFPYTSCYIHSLPEKTRFEDSIASRDEQGWEFYEDEGSEYIKIIGPDMFLNGTYVVSYRKKDLHDGCLAKMNITNDVVSIQLEMSVPFRRP